jgi:hypothetical protein
LRHSFHPHLLAGYLPDFFNDVALIVGLRLQLPRAAC